MTDIVMPRLTDQMEEGTIVAWLVEDGQEVTAGQEIVEVETDKATMAHPSEVDGVLRIVASVGDTVPVGEVIARVGVAAGEARSVGRAADGARAAPEPAPEAGAPAPVPAMAATAPPVASSGNGATRRLVTPLARRVAGEHGIDPTGLAGSGAGGRVTRGDVLRAAGIELAPGTEPPAPPPSSVPGAAPAPTEASAEPAPADASAGTRIQQPTRLQQVAARRMAEATATVPHFQVQTEVRIDQAIALRAQLKAASPEGAAVPSINDLIVKACALALPAHPLVNGSFKDGVFELHDHVHVGIAVASDDGLVVATIPDADIKSLGQVAREGRRLAERVRAGNATPAELTGATFTVSNLGMFGMTAITAVINPPQAAILGVGAARPTLARGDDGEIVDQQLLTLTLSCDHRILNGADGSRFLFDVKQCLESPLRLAL
jgi:pyruvate dehydrogenase E2 component (dihydrolipoamide acetyltransferase)